MTERSFNSLLELRMEIDTLKIRRFEQEEEIKQKFSSPAAIFSTVTSLFKSDNAGKKPFLGNLLHEDLISSVSRLVLPLILNTFVFRRSGFITKAIVTFLSQKAAKNVNTNVVADVVDKIKGIFKKNKNAKSNGQSMKDYGIPPDSETY